MTGNDRWPGWLEVLRPDEVTRARVRRAIYREAGPLLAKHRESWFDTVSDWATVLSPVAAAVTLVFAGLALRQAADTQGVIEDVAQAPVVEELVAPGAALPTAFAGDTVPNLDVVMTVLYEPVEPR